MKKLLKILLYGVGVLVIAVTGLVLWVSFAMPNVGPPEDMVIELTEERVERGNYLANHVMLCMDCHAIRDFSLFSGPPIPETLGAGGEIFEHSMGFPGVYVSANITPGGVGDWTDGELFRLITTGVKRDGQPIFPVMPYPNYAQVDEEDIKAVIAYIRTLDPITTDHPKSKPDFPMNLLLRTMPEKAKLKQKPSKSDVVAYGEYMLVAGACADCHTKFEKGKYTGQHLAGGREFVFPDGSVLRSANLTPHKSGIGTWTKEQFIERFKMYDPETYVPDHVQPGDFQTVMPWVMYAGMETEDIAAIYEYLKTLPGADNVVEKYTPAKTSGK